MPVWIHVIAFLFFLVTVVDFFPMNSVRDPQTSLFNNFFIKNWSHGTIHTFKNYFTTVFLVFSFSKISSIQMDSKSQELRKLLSL